MPLVCLALHWALTCLGTDIVPWTLGSWTRTVLGLSPEDGKDDIKGGLQPAHLVICI